MSLNSHNVVSIVGQCWTEAQNEESVVNHLNLSEKHFATRAIHAGQHPSQWLSRAVIPPITMATTFEQPYPGDYSNFYYGRSGNPTRKCLEEAIASLESAKYGLCFSSGLSAQVNIIHLLRTGDHIVCFEEVYGGSDRNFRTFAADFGIELSFVDARDPNNVRNALKCNTRLVWVETPTNPTMKLVDIKAVAEVVKSGAPNAILVVDNTFMTPYFLKPLLLGADVVMHSLTKYMNGHSDVVMGAVATNDQQIYEKLKLKQKSVGAVPSPFDCFLVNRGLKTLVLRMEQHMKNGLAVAHFLETHPMIREVIHPGLKSHPQHELAVRQFSGFNGMLSVYLKGDQKTVQTFIKSLKIFTLGESLGSVESLIGVPALMSHGSVPQEVKQQLGIDDTLIRLSVGIECIEDLLSDLNHALNVALKFSKSIK